MMHLSLNRLSDLLKQKRNEKKLRRNSFVKKQESTGI